MTLPPRSVDSSDAAKSRLISPSPPTGPGALRTALGIPAHPAPHHPLLRIRFIHNCSSFILGRRHTSPYRPTSDASSRHHPAAYIAVRRRPVHGCPRPTVLRPVRRSSIKDMVVALADRQLPGRRCVGVVDEQNTAYLSSVKPTPRGPTGHRCSRANMTSYAHVYS